MALAFYSIIFLCIKNNKRVYLNINFNDRLAGSSATRVNLAAYNSVQDVDHLNVLFLLSAYEKRPLVVGLQTSRDFSGSWTLPGACIFGCLH